MILHKKMQISGQTLKELASEKEKEWKNLQELRFVKTIYNFSVHSMFHSTIYFLWYSSDVLFIFISFKTQLGVIM